ncbi:hypothetical protein RF11_16156 [Thelohanellus kitauei]|uniref:Uncharacterized protein n=1 Tax=Thelohanellus kitauei TaxID=669202 RepID=A0A0C2N1I6_THEKT|nr:hypothetical protein RF11_16156 [Thelohanellus kitauei]
MEKAAARRVDAHAILALMKTIFRFRTAEYMRNARGTQIQMGDCMNGICKCHKSFGVKFCKWYNGNACDKPVETVDIIFDYTGVHVIITDYYLPVCVALHKNCQRLYMIHFNYEGTHIEKITGQRFDRAKGLYDQCSRVPCKSNLPKDTQICNKDRSSEAKRKGLNANQRLYLLSFSRNLHRMLGLQIRRFTSRSCLKHFSNRFLS